MKTKISKEVAPFRWIISKNIVGRGWIGLVKICSR